jgi:V8-like Glu-specific endopeptidase
MPRIQANRDSIDDRFSVLGFTVRTESPLFEVAVATDPRLFKTENRARRSRGNFHSSRADGAIRARRGEAVYLVPPDVLANFVGQPKLYFGLATYREASGGIPDFVQAPTEGHMYVNLSGLTERGLRRLAGRPTGNGYGGGNGADPSLDWGGDAQPQAATAPAAAPAVSASPAAAARPNGAPTAAAAAYDDGFGDFPRALEEDGDDGGGIDGPIPDDEQTAVAVEQALRARALDTPQPEYPGASRFAPAHPSNYLAMRSPREIRQIVIHITDGGRRITGTIGWFQNPNQRNARNQPIHVSAHYVVGQDGEVVQMVRNNDIAWHASSANAHSIGIEHVANSNRARNLLPTDAEYRGSAKLVAWLCQCFGLPIDRTHVLGHSEADPHTTHTDCPNSVWDWDRYMAMVQEEAAALAAPAATAPAAQALEIITPFYDPADPATALTCQANAFSQAREEWFAGVPNTTIFPHSAICLLEMKDGSGSVSGYGTGFYIGANRILTCGHNLRGAASVDVVPACNDTSEPYGRFNVTSASWRIPASYNGDGDYDLAVIDNVPQAAPNNRWFDCLEELNQSRPEGVVVCGYSRKSDRVPELTQAMNGRMQHLHAGYIAQLRGEVFDYPILTLHRASGSPVYYLSDRDGTMKAYVVGVHISGEIAQAQNLNTGCRLTEAKIAWIQGRSASLALGAAPAPRRRSSAAAFQRVPRPEAIPGRAGAAIAERPATRAKAKALIIGPEDVEQAQRYAPQWADLFNWSVPDWIPGYLAGRNMSVQRIADAVGALNLDRYEIRITSLPSGYTDETLLENVRLHINDFLDTRNSEFIPYASGDDDVKWASSAPTGTVFKIDIIGPDNAAVVCSLKEAKRWRFTTIHTEWSGDHPVSGHREFGVRTDADGSVVIYTRGADRATDGLGESIAFFGADNLWRSFQSKVVDFVTSNGGAATAPEPFSQRFHPSVVEILYGHGTVAQSLENQCYSIHWDTVPYYPQQTDSSCWAAAAAMVVAWRDGVTLTDADIAAKVPAIDAYRNGLWPSDRHMLADVWNLVPEPPACYTIDAWRSMLETYGPLFLDMTNSVGTGGHAWVLVGMTSDGAPDGSDTVMYLHNPSPSRGKVKWNFNDFQNLYEGRVATEGATLEYQVMHAAALPPGRRPVTAAPFSLGLASDVQPVARRAPQRARAKSLGTESIEYPVQLIPQPNKVACWAASMAMLLSFRRNATFSPETLANEVGGSLMTSYGWDLLQAVRQRYGFVAIDVPSNTSLYFSPAQWAQWLRDFGPLWVVIVGMPHAVVVSGLRGNTDDAASCEVKILNPWDTRVTFDDDATEFHPANQGYADWISFQQFASDFGNMAEADYGNWRVLHLPAQQAAAPSPAASAQALATAAVRRADRSARALLAAPPPSRRAFGLEDTSPADEPIEPSRVPGTTMRRARGSRGRVTWSLDQLDGVKLPDPAAAMVPALVPTTIALDQWPCVAHDAVPLPLTVRFDAGGGAVGNVRITAGTAADMPYDVTITATIEDEPQPIAGTGTPQAAIKVTVDVDFSGTPNGNVTARTKLRLVGNGRYDLDSAWQ